MPSVFVDWDNEVGQGRVVGKGDLKVQLQPVGQAQAWYGPRFAILWECYLHEPRKKGNWQKLLAEVWQIVEKDIGVKKFFTQPHDPEFEQGYTEFLNSLEYAPDREDSHWWSKIVP